MAASPSAGSMASSARPRFATSRWMDACTAPDAAAGCSRRVSSEVRVARSRIRSSCCSSGQPRKPRAGANRTTVLALTSARWAISAISEYDASC